MSVDDDWLGQSNMPEPVPHGVDYRPPGDGPPKTLSSELEFGYSMSGSVDVAFDMKTWKANPQGVTPWRAKELMDSHVDVYAPIRLYCPEALGKGINTILILDKAKVDFNLRRSELELLSLHEFSRLVEFLLQWREARQPEDKARLFARIEVCRQIRMERPDFSSSPVVMKALKIFDVPKTLETAPSFASPLGALPPAEELPDLVTLDQAASIVHRSKRTLERYKTKGSLPAPAVEGGGGQADYWEWVTIRPVLERLFKRKLPARFPASRRT
jgi:hypothetical protein